MSDTESRTGDAPGDEGDANPVTGAGAGTIRSELGKHGEKRSGELPDDDGVTEKAAQELDSDASGPTRSE
ncbi:MAG: hypothetical protein QOJ30_1092 [Pseudonocardiales bacterium]|nr:hypothetical protein [Pseudonocardiales bacterium]HEV7472078.1 hypothetical protein [Pseudonocardia sp.]